MMSREEMIGLRDELRRNPGAYLTNAAAIQLIDHLILVSQTMSGALDILGRLADKVTNMENERECRCLPGKLPK